MSFTDLFRSRSALLKRREEVGKKNEIIILFNLEQFDGDDASDDDDIQTFKSKPKAKKTKTKTEKKTRVSKKKTSQSEQIEEKASSATQEVYEIEDDENRAPEFLNDIEQHVEKNKSALDAMQKLR